ncbi:muts domain V-domain-containing protein [Echria macrotheca]|uniref:Muts domain V-domain-containing protein n=1 Tax=Echria macrotheca TaxID=438768 RepID=A0AAJ0F852_9PEZI|nr:muts domain V-domain-containing protein [Echria macrotheca]
MAIDMGEGGRVGCSYFSAADGTLHIEEEWAMGGTEAVETLLLRVRPTTVLVPNRSSIALIELLERDAQGLYDENIHHRAGSHILRHLVSAEFNYETAKDALACLNIVREGRNSLEVLPTDDHATGYIGSSRHADLTRLSRTIDLDNYISVGCAGAVLGDIERRRAAENVPGENDDAPAFVVRSLIMETPENTMIVSADALISLQILHSELHPNPQANHSNISEAKAKESLSVYGLLQMFARTGPGKAKLRQMLFRPSTDPELIEERQRAIATFLRPQNQETVRAIRKLMGKIKNGKILLRHVRLGVDRIRGQLSLRTKEWKTLLHHAMVAIQIRDSVISLSGYENAALLMDACELIDIRQLYEIGAKISSTIDFQLSDESGHTVIQPGNSQNLDELKKLFYRVSDWLPKLKEDVVATVPHGARRCIEYCTMIPQLGFFVAVTLDPETNQGAYNGENSMDGEWELRFIADDLAFYKNPMMLELDAEHGDLHTRISDEEISIMVNLASEILVHEEAVTRSSDALGELDSLLALAAAAEKYNWTAPQITLSNVIEISEGRHPLQELIVPSFIPNDCSVEGGAGTLDGDDTSSYGSDDDSLSDNAEQTSNTTEGLGPHSGSRRNPHQASERGSESDHTIARGGDPPSPPSMLILTGPNNSGKSIYMKQVALIVFLAHIGSYVPALRATIGITDRILTRIATRETVVDDESAFLVDLRQAAFTINFATRRSLVLADEFGKGTSVETGSAVFAAYLAHFLAMEGDRPKVLVGTHFHDVFEHNLLEPLDFVGFAHMETHENPQARDVEDQLVYLYQLLPGRGPSSLALSCAAIHGVERAIIDRARELIGYMDNNEDLEVIMSRDRDERDAHKTGPARRIATGLINARLPYVDEPGGREGDVRELLRRLLAVEEEGERMDEGGGRDGYAGNIDMMDERGYEMEE